MRERVDGLPEVGTRPAAQQINTFVSGARPTVQNQFTEFARLLNPVTEYINTEKEKKDLEQDEEMRIKAADDKMYGQNAATRIAMDLEREYRSNPDKYGSLDQLQEELYNRFTAAGEEYQVNQSKHTKAGFDERYQDLTLRFLEGHNDHLIKRNMEKRDSAISENLYGTFSTKSVQDGYKTIEEIAKVYGVSPKQLNPFLLQTATVLAAQGNTARAKEILEYNRGASKSLLTNEKDLQSMEKASQIFGMITRKEQEERGIGVSKFKLDAMTKADKGELSDYEVNNLQALAESGDISFAERDNILKINKTRIEDNTAMYSLAENFDKNQFFLPVSNDPNKDEELKEKYANELFSNVAKQEAQDISLVPEDDQRGRVTAQQRSLVTSLAITDKTGKKDPRYSALLNNSFYQYNPSAVLETGEVPQALSSAVAYYRNIKQYNPNAARLYIGDNKQMDDFFSKVDVMMNYQGMTAEQAIKNIASSENTPDGLPVPSPKVDDLDEQLFSKLSKRSAGFFTSDDIQNASELIPAGRILARDLMRKGMSPENAVAGAKEIIENKTVVIKGRAYDKGLHNLPDNFEDISEAAVKTYWETNKSKLNSIYEDYDDLVLIPSPSSRNLYFILDDRNVLIDTVTKQDLDQVKLKK